MCHYENIVKKSQKEKYYVELINNFTIHMDVWTLAGVVSIILQIKNFKEKEKIRQEQRQAKKEVEQILREILSNLLQKR